MVNNKDWDALLRFLSYNFKRNPKLPEDFDEKYIEKLHFNRDSYSEKLESTAKNVSLEDDNIVIEFENFVPYNQEDNFNSVNFKLLKNSKEYKGMRECHIEPDWLLIYKIENRLLILKLIRTGTHSDLFK